MYSSLRALLRLVHVSARTLIWLALLLLITAGVLAAVSRFYVLPHLDQYRVQLASGMSAALGRPVLIGQLQGQWSAAHIELTVRNIEVRDKQGTAMASVRYARGQLSWWSLLRRDVLFRDAQVEGVHLRLGRDGRGRLWLGDLPLAAGDSTQLPDWLLRQGRLDLRDAHLVWQDGLNSGKVQQFYDIQAQYDGGFFINEAQLSLRLAEGADPVRLGASWRGKSVQRMDSWRGSVDLRVPDSSLERLLLPGMPGGRLAGTAGGWLKLDFAKGLIQRGQGEWAAHDIRYHSAAGALVPIDSASGHFAVSAWKGQGLRLKFQRLRLKLPGEGGDHELDGLAMAYRPADKTLAQGAVDVPRLDAQRVRNLLVHLQATRGVDLVALAPGGTLQQVHYQWQGSLRAPRLYQLSASLSNGRWAALGAAPAVSGIDAVFKLNERGGSLDFKPAAGTALTLTLPQLFEQTLNWTQFDGHLRWQWRRQGLHIDLDRLQLANADVIGTLKGTYDWQPGSLGTIRLDGDFGPVRASSVGPYLPKVVGVPALAWLRQAFTAGTVNQTRLSLRGDLADFPFEDPASGQFLVAGELQGVQLNYSDGWPTVDAINGSMRFEGRGMVIDARSASILGARVSATRARIAELDAAHPLLRITGEVNGHTRSMLDFVSKSPLQARLGRLLGALDVDGSGQLKLGLDLPLNELDSTRVSGRYVFAGNTLLPRAGIPRVDAVSGMLDFSEKGVTLQRARGKSLGGDIVLDARTRKDGVTELEINGRADLRQAAQFYQLPLEALLAGSSAYRLLLADESDGLRLQLASDLQGASLSLPAPYGKTAAQSAALKLDMQVGARAREQWTVSYQQLLGAALVYAPTANGLALERGQIMLGSARIPGASRPGLWLSGRMPMLRVSEWQGLLAAGSASAGSVQGVDMVIDALEWQGRRWTQLAVNLQRKAPGWSGSVQSPLMQGQIAADFSGRGHIKAQMQYLSLPGKGVVAPAKRALPETAASLLDDPGRWPALEVDIEHLQFAGRDLGRLVLNGSALGNGYRLNTIKLDNEDGTLLAQASWLREGMLWRGQLGVDLAGKDFGRWLGRWGQGNLLQHGRGTFSARLEWLRPGVLPSLLDLEGQLHLQAGKGTLLKVNPGVGRLLGLINIESLLRRVRLDFQDVLKQGLAFDTLQASARLLRGNVAIQSMRLEGPALDIGVTGLVNVQTEALNLRVKVIPSLSGGVAVAGAIVNPVVGLSLLVLQQLFSNPVGKMLTYTYNVTGTWSKPDLRSPAERAAAADAAVARP